ncbi:peptidylprolyl isomerase [Melioribacteraceae bacterium 4301-Me]|uniref:peptidylprolyl isomerase n=1 Tax=Pyranulibacter aquaticus TaxID=3163344 RepID=UPI00359836A0
MKYFLKYLCLLIFFLYPFNKFLAQNEEDVVARVGNINITVEEFKNRFQLTPFFTDKNNEDIDTTKKEFLYSLIAEKLWSQKAMQDGLDSSIVYKLSISSLKELLLKDELYRKVILDSVLISGNEIKKGVTKFMKELVIDMYASKDSTVINSAYEQLTKNNKVDSALFNNSRLIKLIGKGVTFGDFENEELENLVFALSPGQFTRPFHTRDGWIIVKLISVHTNPSVINKTQDAVSNIVYQKIFERKAGKRSEIYLDEKLGGLRVEVDKKLFYKLVNEIKKTLTESYKGQDSADISSYELTDEMLMKIFQDIEHKETDYFVKIPSNGKTLQQFIFYLLHQKFRVDEITNGKIETELHKNVRSFIEQSILVKEAEKRGLESSTAIQKDIKLWNENYLAQIELKKIFDTLNVNENELYAYYKQKYHSIEGIEQVNILEILNSDLDVIDTVLTLLNAGHDFRELAKKYTQRKSLKAVGGEWGFFPVTEGGEIGKVAAKLKLNEIYGPIKTPEGYSIVKLIGRKIAENKDSLKYSDVKNILRTQLRIKKFDYEVEKATSSLALKYGIQVDNSLLEKINVVPVKMFTVRFLGFGGKMTALPLTIPLYNWYKDYLSKKALVP